jgi:hypothetical protein
LSKKNTLDQYYTKKEVAEWCWEKVLDLYGHSNLFLEPSAGTGAFLRDDVSIEAFDIDPKIDGIVKSDFLELDKELLVGKIVVGNPPFGWASSLALKFINHSKDAKAICFVLPKTFMKKVFQENISDNLHLVGEWELPKSSFLLDGSDYDVPCCFQIWENRSYKKEPLKIKTYIKECEQGTYFLRRVGGRAGMFVSEDDYTKSTTYRVSCSEEVKNRVEDLYSKIKNVASCTAGVRSITLKEINYILTEEILCNTNTNE